MKSFILKNRLICIVILTISMLIGSGIICYLNLQNSFTSLEKKKIISLIESVNSILTVNIANRTNDQEQFSEIIIKSVKNNPAEPFWIYDIKSKQILFTHKDKFMGEDIASVKNLRGENLFANINNIISIQNNEVLDEYFIKPNGHTKKIHFISFAKLIPQTNIVIGSSNNTEDMNSYLNKFIFEYTICSIFILFVQTSLLFIVFQNLPQNEISSTTQEDYITILNNITKEIDNHPQTIKTSKKPDINITLEIEQIRLIAKSLETKFLQCSEIKKQINHTYKTNSVDDNFSNIMQEILSKLNLLAEHEQQFTILSVNTSIESQKSLNNDNALRIIATEMLNLTKQNKININQLTTLIKQLEANLDSKSYTHSQYSNNHQIQIDYEQILSLTNKILNILESICSKALQSNELQYTESK
jgi:hypothetical protein